jgi:hypothetical protein
LQYQGNHHQEEIMTITEPLAWPEGHFTSVGIPVKDGYFLSRCKCGAERLITSLQEGWAWSSQHQKEAWQPRLEELRAAIDAENISWGEIAELQSLVEFIEPGDWELLAWAGDTEA